jgi:hypothetical protein
LPDNLTYVRYQDLSSKELEVCTFIHT